MSEYKEPKKLYQVLNYYADWLIRIIVVNFLTILTMLPIITIIPALTAAYKILSDALHKDEVPIFKSYFKYFKEAIVDKMILSIIIIIILVVTYYNNVLYGEMITKGANILYTIGYYITITIIVATLMITMYIPLVYTERNEYKMGEVIKMSFYLSGKYFVRTIFIAMTLLIPFLMLLSEVMFLFFMFFGITVPMLIIAAITKKPRKFLQETEGKI